MEKIDKDPPSHELPKPIDSSVSPEVRGIGGQGIELGEQATAQAVEAGLGVSQQTPTNGSTQGTDSPITQTGQPMPASVADASTHAASPSATPVADDTDLIEKEWVDRAKRIVESTRSDPHQQNEEITRIKADYMMKRYQKELKIKETS